MASAFEPIEPKHQIEQMNFSLYMLSKKGELKPREEPRVVNDLEGGSTVFFNFEAVPGEDLRVFVRHDSPVDASADVYFEGRSLGKWSISGESKVWHNIASDSLFKFQDSYDHQSKVFEPSTFEIRFQYLSRVTERCDLDVLVPTIVREPSLEDGPGWVRPSDELMQSQFESVEDDPFLTFVISVHPPPATSSPPTTSSPLITSSLPTSPSSLLTTSTLPTTSTSFTTSTLSTTSTTLTASSSLMTSSRPATPISLLTTSSLPTTSSVSTTSTLYTTSSLYTTPTTSTPGSPLSTPSSPITQSRSDLKPPVANPEPAPASTLPSGCSPAPSLSSATSISRMSDDELQEALSEYEKSSLLLPPRLIPGFRGKLSIEDFCRRYELPEDTLPLLAQMGIKDAHGLSSKRLSDLRDKGMVPKSIKMLRLAVIRFSSDSGL